jgi:undecaprenyl diphosphate synthase
MSDSPNHSNLPRHIAIIMDGNGRWAKKRFMPRFAGHKAGVESVRRVVKECARLNIEALTLFAFSSENWRRPEKEVGLLMDLLHMALQREVGKLNENNIRLRFIGDRSAFSDKLQQQMRHGEELTRDNTGLNLVIAINYGGRWDIAQAARKVAARVEAGELKAQEINTDVIHQHMSLNGLPEPDLFIRTGGEKRVSNFLLWDLAYSELYFTDKLWPEFNIDVLEDALASFSSRERRFGRTSEQVEQDKSA